MRSILNLGLCLLVSNFLIAQSIEGLWLIESVQVGAKSMTPDMRWFKFENGALESGNGFLKNGKGTYEFDARENTLSIRDSLALEDQNGPFKVEDLGAEQMVMSRQEEGMSVKVISRKVNAVPMALADKLSGYWAGRENFSIYLSWDRSYKLYHLDGSIEYGVWRNHPHKKELALLPWDRKKASRFLAIDVNGKDLILKDLKSNDEFRLKRSRKRN